MRKMSLAVLTASAALVSFAAAGLSAPASLNLAAAVTRDASSATVLVHWRRWPHCHRRCHWHNGWYHCHRRCHGGRKFWY